jgi:hypothetical protein
MGDFAATVNWTVEGALRSMARRTSIPMTLNELMSATTTNTVPESAKSASNEHLDLTEFDPLMSTKSDHKYYALARIVMAAVTTIATSAKSMQTVINEWKMAETNCDIKDLDKIMAKESQLWLKMTLHPQCSNPPSDCERASHLRGLFTRDIPNSFIRSAAKLGVQHNDLTFDTAVKIL